MNDDELAAISALAEAATPGPWVAEPDTGAGRVWVQRAPRHHGKDCEPLFSVRDHGTKRNDPEIAAAFQQRAADAAFIAAARTAVPALVADAKRLREREHALIRAKDADLDDVRDECDSLRRSLAEAQATLADVEALVHKRSEDGAHLSAEPLTEVARLLCDVPRLPATAVLGLFSLGEHDNCAATGETE